MPYSSQSGQLRLFDPGCPTARMIRDGADIPCNDWPPPETGMSRPGFQYDRSPAVFGARRGLGPLIVAPDANILIDMHENLETVEELVGLNWGPLVADEWPTVPEAIRDLLGVWWWRDIRLWVDPDVLLRDARRGVMPANRAAARRRTVRAWEKDFWARGGFDIDLELRDELPEGLRCPSHPVHIGWFAAPVPGEPRWPKGPLDRRLVRSAFDAGCHVFLTEDKDVLRCHPTMLPRGMAVMRPQDLLTELDATDELEPIGSPSDPSPDMQALATFYKLMSPADALEYEQATGSEKPSADA